MKFRWKVVYRFHSLTFLRSRYVSNPFCVLCFYTNLRNIKFFYSLTPTGWRSRPHKEFSQILFFYRIPHMEENVVMSAIGVLCIENIRWKYARKKNYFSKLELKKGTRKVSQWYFRKCIWKIRVRNGTIYVHYILCIQICIRP